MISCIYKITNTVNGKFYIGSTRDLAGRKRKHLSELRRDLHGNAHLQAAFNLYGEASFEWSVMVECEQHQLLDLEQKLIDETDCTNREVGYNVSLVAGAPMAGRKHTEASLDKMKQAKLGDKNTFYGKQHTDHTKQLLRDAMVGRTLTPEHREKVLKTAFSSGETNVNAKLTMEKAREIRALAEEYKQLKGTMYGFYSKAAKIYGVNSTTITNIVKGTTWREQ